MKPVWEVESYWYRQEFGKSRGMINWHDLCLFTDREKHNMMYRAVLNKLSGDEMGRQFSEWAKSAFV